MKQLINLPKVRKYDDRGKVMTKEEQQKDLERRILIKLKKNEK